MEVSNRIKFVAIVFVGTVSLFLLFDKLDFNSNSKTIPLIRNKTLKTMKISSKLNRSLNEIQLKRKRIEFEFNLLEEKNLKNGRKVSKDSKLIPGSAFVDITRTLCDRSCGQNFGQDLAVLVVVISRANGFKRRQLIRDTWKRVPLNGVHVVFGVGRSRDNSTEAAIAAECGFHGDLIQWQFVDHYNNLTLKSLAILRHFALNCFGARFLYKVDDDSILNLNNLRAFLNNARNDVIYGQLWRRASVDRKKKSKFFLSRADFAPAVYPDYTGGPWLVSGHVVRSLYETALNSLPALPFEDVFVTGIVAAKTRVKRKQLPGLVYFAKDLFNKVNKCWFEENVIFWQSIDDQMMETMWRNIQTTRHMTCLTKNGSFAPTK